MKLLLVGLDALDYRLFTCGAFQWFDELISRSNHGIARPDNNWAWTGPSWMSIYTGLKIENHGVTDMFGRENWAEQGSKSFSSLGRKCIWDYLNEAGLFCGVMNFPATWPAPAIQGWFISGWWSELSYTPKLLGGVLEDSGYISDYLDTVFKEQGEFRSKVDLEGKPFDWTKVKHSLEDTFERCVHVMKTQLDALVSLPPVDCLMVQFPILDRLGHRTIGIKNRERCYEMMGRMYFQAEWAMQVLIERYRPEFIAVISDHGWQVEPENRWLGDVHSEYGTWLISGPDVAEDKQVDIWNYDFLPNLLKTLDLLVLEDIDGRPKVILKTDEEIIAERLERWGYFEAIEIT